MIRSWKELFSGYGKDPKDILTVFDAENHDQMVLLKNIEIYSMCEHHFLPFVGEAHIAYIPNEKIVGISKLARIAEIYQSSRCRCRNLCTASLYEISRG